MTCPIQPGPYFLAALKIEESPRISLFLSVRNPQKERTSIRLFPNRSSLINHYDESHLVYGGVRGVVVIAVGNEHGDTSSNPGRD